MEAESGSAAHPSAVPPFLNKCFDMVDDPATDRAVSWTEAGSSFVIWDPHAFSRDLLPKYFKHGNLSSFVRQLNTYGFRKVDPDRLEFANEGFLRGQKYLLKNIIRRKPTHSIVQTPQLQGKSTSVKACVELGKYGLEEEIERLRRDKNILMQELVKLRQHQQSTDHQLHTLTERLQGMEENQQQMLSFLAMAVQNPNFLSHLVQQNGNRWRPEANKKRRLPALEQGAMDGLVASNGQIIKYQPLLSETASPCLTSIPHGDIAANLPTQFDGVNGLCTSTDLRPPGTKQSLPAQEGFLPSELFDLEELLFNSQSENNYGAIKSDMGIPDFDIDYDLLVQNNQMEQVQNAVLPNEQLREPELPDKDDPM